MSGPEQTAYDRYIYPGSPFAETHPARLATLASLHRIEAAPVSRCRVLELGCGDGGNLIPMAYQWPRSQFVGIDLSARAVEQGNKLIAALELKNIRLSHFDIMDIGPDFGVFDYIVAHGVYSWVPAAVREKIMAVFGRHLAPAGIAYVSYNCYPGSYLRDLGRGVMLFHVRKIEDPEEKVLQARALLAALAEESDEQTSYGTVLRSVFDRVSQMPGAVLYHDDLDEGATAFFLKDVVEAGAREGLQYLADANYPRLNLSTPPHGAKLIGQIPKEEYVLREQYLDLVEGRSFRASLLCRAECNLSRDIEPSCVTQYWIAAHSVPADGGVDPREIGVAEFNAGAHGKITTDHRLSKSAFLYLGTVWPRAVRFDELLEHALKGLGPDAEAIRARLDDEVRALTSVLSQAFSSGMLQLYLEPPRLTTTVGERPVASALARKQAETRTRVANLVHGNVLLEDERVRRFLALVDGTRNVDELVRDLSIALGAGNKDAPAVTRGDTPVSREDTPVSREGVERNLSVLARRGLLVA